ncbi:MAG: sporulation protein YqfD [bacterium]|nr:sporulation protein YqfD [bacterium]
MNQYELKITGKDLKRFLKNLHSMNIQMHNIEYLDKSIIIRVNEEDYKKIKNIKTIYEIEVTQYFGPVKILVFLKKYRIFFFFLMLGILTIYFLSYLVFDITIVHNKKEIRNLVLEELKEHGIEKYHFILSFDKQEQIVENIIQKHRDIIEWMEIERVGVSYIVKVEERKVKELDTSSEPRDLVAKKDGLIVNVEASEGSVVTTPGKYVKKGDILVTGKIMNKETLMAKVRATGKVFAETWYDVTVELPYHYQEESKTGNQKKVLTINFLGETINLFDFNPYENKKVKPIQTIKNPLLPISISLNQEIEVEKKDYLYTKEMAIVEASNIARNKLRKKLGEEDQILYEKSLKISEEDSKIIIVIFFKVKEDITAYQQIPEEVKDPEVES